MDMGNTSTKLVKNINDGSYEIIGAAMEVHKRLGCGFLEAVYQEALEEELKLKQIPYKREQEINISYRDKQLKTYYKADFICYDKVILELKAIKQIGEIEYAQILNYLKATGYKTGILLNFGAKSLEHKRFLN
jgi:GxxExxY protein